MTDNISLQHIPKNKYVRGANTFSQCWKALIRTTNTSYEQRRNSTHSSSGVSCTGSLVNCVSKFSKPYSSEIWGLKGAVISFFSSWRKTNPLTCVITVCHNSFSLQNYGAEAKERRTNSLCQNTANDHVDLFLIRCLFLGFLTFFLCCRFLKSFQSRFRDWRRVGRRRK